MKLHLVAWLPIVVFAGCETPKVDVPTAAAFAKTLSLENDYYIPASNGLGRSESALTNGDGPQGQQILFINFGGATLTVSQNPEDNATLNETWIPNPPHAVGSMLTFPAFDASPYAPTYTAAAAQQNIVNQVTAWYQNYNVTVVSTRPPAGKHYTMLMVGGNTSDFVQAGGDAIGVAPLDCGNSSQVNIGFAFASTLAASNPPNNADSRNTDLLLLAQTVAHEAGHSFGLEHVNTLGDIMTPAVAQTVTGFVDTNGPLSSPNEPGACTTGTTQDSNTRLLANLGPVPAGTGPARPIVTFLAPMDGDKVPFQFTAAVSVSEPMGAGGTITKVDLSQSGTVLKSFTTPPYSIMFDATGQIPDGTEVTLIATATNSLGGVAQSQSTFTFSSTATQGTVGCLIDADCVSPGKCMGGMCVGSAPAIDCNPPCGADETCQADGTCLPNASLGNDAGTIGTGGSNDGGTAQVGAGCTDSSTCGTGGVCAQSGGKGYCTVVCDPSNVTSCPAAYQCVAVGADHYCGPVPSGCDMTGSSTPAPLAPVLVLLMGGFIVRRRRLRPSAA